MEEEWQKQLKLSRKLSRELSAKGVNTEVREDEIKTKKLMKTMEVRAMKKEMVLKITMGRKMTKIIEKFHGIFRQVKYFLQKRQGYPVQCLRN